MSSQNNPLARLARRSRIHIALAAIAAAVAAPWTTMPAAATSFTIQTGQNGVASTRVQDRLHILQGRYVGREPAETRLNVAVTLPLRNHAELDDVVRRLYDPADPLYGKYLTPTQFDERFGATEADHDAVVAYLKSRGLTVDPNVPGHNLILVSGPASKVQAAFGVTINRYHLANGRDAYANAGEPVVPHDLTDKISGVIGLDNLSPKRTHLEFGDPLMPRLGTRVIGSGPFGGMTPTDIKAAYNLANTTLNGDGQTVGLIELDGYLHTDIKGYTNRFNLGDANLEDININGFNGLPVTPGGTVEVVLDIEMVAALAPKSNIQVYMANNTGSNLVALFNEASHHPDTKVFSCSWGLAETLEQDAEIQADNNIFLQMVSQGQSMYVASGDDGAFDDFTKPTTPAVDNPSGQPNAIGVGGTTLRVTGRGGTYVSEKAWSGSGGGISSKWPKPGYQKGFGSTTDKREVPDVSLNADPNTGYAVFATVPGGGAGSFAVSPVGGTSASAPLWAAFTALVNQQRVINGTDLLGFASFQLYALAKTDQYVDVFHDIKDNSTNGLYPAVTGYDDVTGLGTFVGDQLIKALAPPIGGPPGKVTGVVTDEDGIPINISDGTSIRGAVTITAYLGESSTSAATTTTDTNGSYTLSIPSAASFTIKVDSPGYAGQILVNVTVPPNGTVTHDIVLKQAHHFEQNGVQMISAPYDFTRTADFTSILTLTPDSFTKPPLITWQASVNRYVKTPNAPADTFRLGQGYWVKMPTTGYINKQGAPAPVDQPFRIRLQKGWNQIGDPFLIDIAVKDLLVDKLIPDVPDAPVGIGEAGNTLVKPIFWSFDSAAYADGKYPYVQNDLTGTLHPWLGYWVFANSACVVIFPSPESGPPGPPPGPL